MSHLKDTTAFIGNGIGIDPPGCGCTDCIVGDSYPCDTYGLEEIIGEYVGVGRPIYNRSSRPLDLIVPVVTRQRIWVENGDSYKP